MKVIIPNCPSCGGAYDGPITGGILTCEYCGAKFALEADELEALGFTAGGYDEGYEDDYEEEELQPVFDFAREKCEEFLRKVGSSEFQSSKAIMDGLGVDDYEEVFLIHDDTLFKSGKNGFAITDYGFYCRDMGEPQAYYYKWGDFAEYGKPYIDGSHIMADGFMLAYFTGNDSVREELKSLYRKLRKHAKQFDWIDPE